MKALIIAATLLMPGVAAAGEYQSGEELFQACSVPPARSAPPGFGVIFCLGYVEGVASAMDGNEAFGYSACIPGSITAGQLVTIVTRNLAGRAAELPNYGAASLVAHALADAFPCRKSNT